MSFYSSGQKFFEKEVDSLKQLLSKTNSEKKKADLYIEIAQKYTTKDSLEAIKFAKKAIKIGKKKDYPKILVDAIEVNALIALRVRNLENAEIRYQKLLKEAKKVNYPRAKAQAFYGLSLVAWYRTEYQQALDFSQQALQIRLKIQDKKGIAISYNSLGVIYKNQGNYIKAIENYLKALKIQEELGNRQNQAKLYNNIGSIHLNQEQYEEALKYYFKSLKIKKEYGDTLSISFTYNNIGEVYKKQNKLNKALDYYFKSLALKKITKGQPTISMTYNNLGVVYQVQENYQKSIEFHQKALDISKKTQDKKEEAKSLVFLGQSYFAQKKYTQAIQYISKGIDLAQRYATPLVLRDGAETLAKTYEATGQFALAYQNYQLYVQMKDSLLNKAQTQRLAHLEADYEFSKQKDSLRYLQEKQNLSLEEEKSKRKVSEQQTFFSVLVLVLLMVVAIIFFGYKQRNNRRLNEANKKLQGLNQELRQSQNAIEEQKEELKQNNNEILRKNKKIEKNIQILSRFSKNEGLLAGDWKNVGVEITKVIVEALSVYSCQLWYYNFKEQKMYCMGYTHKDSSKKIPLTITPQENALFFEMLTQKSEPLIVNNINKNEQLKVANKDYFLHQNYQSFMIYPLFISDKQQGVLACFQEKPQVWENEDIMFLKSMNDELLLTYQSYRREQAKEKIKRQSEEIREINDNLKESINYAQRIQKSILHTQEEIRKTLPHSFIFFRPRDIVSGDFYFYAQTGYKVVIGAIDCTGHGIPGAFMSLIGNDLLYEIVKIKGITSPNLILDLLKEEIMRVLRQKDTGNQDGMDVALCTIDRYPEALQEDLGLPTLQYAGAKNSLLLIQNKEMQIIKGDKITIGGVEEKNEELRFNNHLIPLFQELTFYIFSDGIQDQFGGPKNKKFSPRRLRNLLLENHQKPMQEQAKNLSDAIDLWQIEGKEAQVDDMLLIGVKI